ncbi:serine/threonine-protein phosphatase 5-like protein [Gorgonomyces haynaldii]|nr:serine/threonine-protein phosphatase 5-like protein [Gorgonomyces haynaldii]
MAEPKPLEVTQQDIDKAEEIKKDANKLFAEHHYQQAIDRYTDAIGYNPNVPQYYANRAFACIKIELYGQALQDADEAIKLDPTYTKGYYRRAMAQMALNHLADAIKDFRQVVKLDQKVFLKYLLECEKEKKARDFADAIAFDEVKESVLKRLGDIDSIVVEDSYQGPRFQDTVDLQFCKDLLVWFKDQKKLHRKYTLQIMRQALEIFNAQPALVDIDIPKGSKLTVCGDIHGQFYDLLYVLETNGLPSPENMYLWNGDFVDRGSFSVECILTLLSFKCLYPQAVYLSRGNHETDDMNRTYGFEGEVKAKYTELVFKFFSELFNAVPLANLIGRPDQERILVIHGGLFSRDDVTLDEIRKIDRFRQPGSQGIMTELLWSDPQPQLGRAPSKRGVGLQFGPDVTEKFCALNKLKMIIRSHEVKDQGYEVMHNGKCVTIFSAPNYCDSVNNLAAYIHVDSDLNVQYHQYRAVPHPNVPPMKYASSLFGGLA